MSKEELKEKLREETERSQKAAARRNAKVQQRKASSPSGKKQKRIAEQTKKQLPPQSPARRKREQEAKRRAELEMKEKKRRRRGSNIVYYILLSVLAVIIFSVLSVTVLFNTEQIIVEGDSDYTEEQIIAASGLQGDENLVRLSLAGLPEKMLDKLVTLDSVTVEKVFPSTIKITVTRSVPMASFLYGGRYYVISHIGRVMSIDDSDPDCMRVIGYKPAESVIVGGFIQAENEQQDKLVQDISAAIEKADIEGIDTVNISDNLAIILTYDDRVQINIGSILQLDEKMRIIRELLFNGHISETEYVTLDVSDPVRARQRPITTAAITAVPETEEAEGEEDAESTDTDDGETTSEQ